jgi:hypothetical protein
VSPGGFIGSPAFLFFTGSDLRGSVVDLPPRDESAVLMEHTLPTYLSTERALQNAVLRCILPLPKITSMEVTDGKRSFELGRSDDYCVRRPAGSGGIAQTRSALDKAVVAVQRSADIWFTKQQCTSCHHSVLPTFALTEAREHGIAIRENSAKKHFAIAIGL